MDIYCAKCGAFFKNWKLDLIECCGTDMSVLAEPKLGGVVARKAAHFISPDIQPYKSMVTGEMITSRKDHREHLKVNRLVEIGNEPIKAPPPPPKINVRKELAEVVRQVYNDPRHNDAR